MKQNESVLKCIGDGSKSISDITVETGIKRESVRRVLSDLSKAGKVTRISDDDQTLYCRVKP